MHTFAKTKRKLKIKDMPISLRPREKLFAYGAHNLSESELLAILLGTGSANYYSFREDKMTR